MYFADLELCHYHRGALDASSWEVPLVAIGWLDAAHPFTCGASPPFLLARLKEFIERAGAAHAQLNFLGLHDCTICEATTRRYRNIRRSNINLFIPDSSVVYAVPGGITHYIEAHSYLPPPGFLAAVLNCPPYGSPDFFKALQTANRGSSPPVVPVEEWARAANAEAELRWLEQIEELLVALSGQLTADEAAGIRHLIERGEPDKGLSTLAWMVETQGKPVPGDLRRRIVELIGVSSEREHLPESFRE